MFDTTDAHRNLRRTVRDFAQIEIAPRVAAMESAPGRVDTQASTLIAEQGWIGVTIPERFGGMGGGHVAKAIVIEEITRVSGAMGAMVQASQLGVAKILHFGTEEQKQTWLPPIAAGSCLPTIAVTEHESGGHVLGMQATARRHGEDYILNGRKVYVGNSHVGDLHGVVVRTGSDRSSQSLTAFLVEADRPGVRLGPLQPAIGLHGFSFGELVLEDVRVPAANRIGDEGDGLAVAYSSSILYGRLNLGPVALGLHQAAMDQTIEFATTRHLYGAPLADLPTIRHKLGLMQHRLMTARLAVYHAAELLDRGEPCDEWLINAKYLNVEAALDTVRTAMEIHAAAGLFTDRPLERLYRDATCIYAPAGTGDIQLLRLAEIALGTYPSHWSQRLAHLTALPAAPPGRQDAASPAA